MKKILLLLAFFPSFCLKANIDDHHFVSGLKDLTPGSKKDSKAHSYCDRAFVENKGQVVNHNGSPQSSVKFVYQQEHIQLFLMEDGLAYQFTKIEYPEGYQDLIRKEKGLQNSEKLQAMQKQIRTETFRMNMNFIGANHQALISKEGESSDYTNYYNKNALNVHSYSKVTYHDIYPGIDWVIHLKDEVVKYDFVVRPGADPSLIKMEFNHQENISLNPDGSFSLASSMGAITEKAPYSFQGDKKIGTRFVLDDTIISFDLENYDHSKTLVIDPALVWATYYGGSGIEYGLSCATDAFGNVYLTGFSQSNVGIAVGGHQVVYGGGSQDAFLVKFNESGLRLWSTYYGSTGSETGISCAIDAGGNIYVVGNTTSTINIASGGHQNNYNGGATDAMVIKFNSNGLRLWASYYGGPGYEVAYSCFADNSGNVYVAGVTNSASDIASGGFLNTFSGADDAFLVKFDGAGVRQWATYYGDLNTETGNSCSVDLNGNVYLTGTSGSSVNISSGGHQNAHGGGVVDAFLVKFNSSGVRLWATYYGGSGPDYGNCCNTDNLGNIYLSGYTYSSNNISSSGHQNTIGGNEDAFLVKFNSSGQRLWASYYGSTGHDYGHYCTTDFSGNVYLAGVTSSTSQIASGGYQNSLGGTDDAFLVKFTGSGLRLWGTYYGGTATDVGDVCVVDWSGSVYLSGETNSSSNIASSGFQNSIGGNDDAFLVKFCSVPPAQPSPIIGNNIACMPGSQTYSIVAVPGAASYSWSLPAGWTGTSSTNSIGLVPVGNGSLSVIAINACGNSSTQTLNIIVNQSPTVSIAGSNTLLCEGFNESATLTVSGATSYTWTTGGNNNVLVVNPVVTTTYNVIGWQNGCSDVGSLAISVDPCTAIEQNRKENGSIDLFPNPNSGLLTVRSEDYQNTELIILTITGKKIMEKIITEKISIVDITQLVSGVYIVALRLENRITQRIRLVKE